MRILVTGGAGFIGRAVVGAFLASGWAVRCLDLVAPSRDDCEVVVGDVRSPGLCDSALAGVDVVCHQAAKVGLGVDVQDLPAYASTNDLGTAVLLAAMARAGVGRLVLASSMVVYGEGRYDCALHGPVAPGPRSEADLASGRFEPPCPRCGAPLLPGLVTEDAPLEPRNAYGASKVAQEHLAAAWARATGGSAVALRYHNVYGPGLPRNTPYAGVAALFLSELAAGRAPRIFEDGRQRRDFVHVSDVAAANVAAAHATGIGAGTRAYNVASGEVRTVGDMAAALASATGGRRPVVTGDYRLGDVRHVTASSARARDELGWRLRVEFADGMADLAAADVSVS